MAAQSAGKPARIRLGMVGGGRDAFIGGVHRIAARLDDHYELIAGAFSASAEKSIASARDLGLATERAYADYQAMAEQEAQREDGIEAVAIVTRCAKTSSRSSRVRCALCADPQLHSLSDDSPGTRYGCSR